MHSLKTIFLIKVQLVFTYKEEALKFNFLYKL